MSITIITADGRKEYESDLKLTLLELLWKHGEKQLHAPCGGKGLCAKCTVFQVTEAGVELPVLACQVIPKDGDVYHLPENLEPVVALTGRHVENFKADAGMQGYGIACDIGTTTIACRLVSLTDGTCVAELGAGNEQIRYGSDVISRIQAAGEGHLSELTEMIRRQLNGMIESLCRRGKVASGDLHCMSVAANTTMCHLLTGLDPRSLGVFPFTPMSRFGECYRASQLDLGFDGEVYVLPAVSGYVGGDITADILATGMDRSDRITLLLDVGTNGEMVLGCGDHMVCCATAAGPAFEGAEIDCGMTAAAGAISSVAWKDGRVACEVIGNREAVGICGSGLIDAVAMMLDLGVLDVTGRMLDRMEDPIPAACLPYLELDEDGCPLFRLTAQVYVSQEDVHKLLMGKGAIAAGTKILLQMYGIEVEQIEALWLAGGFGSCIHVESAARIGLIPRALSKVTHSIGNTAVEGAHGTLISKESRARLARIQSHMEYHELSSLEAFHDAYMEAMTFPEN